MPRPGTSFLALALGKSAPHMRDPYRYSSFSRWCITAWRSPPHPGVVGWTLATTVRLVVVPPVDRIGMFVPWPPSPGGVISRHPGLPPRPGSVGPVLLVPGLPPRPGSVADAPLLTTHRSPPSPCHLHSLRPGLLGLAFLSLAILDPALLGLVANSSHLRGPSRHVRRGVPGAPRLGPIAWYPSPAVTSCLSRSHPRGAASNAPPALLIQGGGGHSRYAFSNVALAIIPARGTERFPWFPSRWLPDGSIRGGHTAGSHQRRAPRSGSPYSPYW